MRTMILLLAAALCFTPTLFADDVRPTDMQADVKGVDVVSAEVDEASALDAAAAEAWSDQLTPEFLSEDPCTTPNYYWLCHGYCYDGDICAKRCSFATHDCCHRLYCLPPTTLCFE